MIYKNKVKDFMARVCEFCGKRTSAGRSISRRGLAKRKGGVGKKVTGITKRTFKPNIQKVRIQDEYGVRRVKICTQCMRLDLITKPSIKQTEAKA
ncbi:MAG TPA: 50S ribosomal protein L28 [Planctomycetota bacterium]|nr:50S ribosomal protein L28 [Planctomycetota bacterium]